MAILAPLKPRTPQSTTLPTFSSPQIQTAADVKTSQKVAGINPKPAYALTPGGGTGPTQGPPKLPQKEPTATPYGGGSLPGGLGAPPKAGAPPAPLPLAPAKPTEQKAGAPTGGLPGALGGIKAPATSPTSTVPTSTGAPPGVPATTPPPVVTPLQPTPKSLEGENAKEAAWTQAQNEQAQRNYEAALAYDGGPTSALAADERAAAKAMESATNARGAAGTIHSSLYAGDKGKIGEALGVANTEAYNTYTKATVAANGNLEKARVLYIQAGEQEKREMQEAAAKREPTEPIVPPPPPPPTTVSAGTPISGVPNPQPPPGPPPPGMEWTPSGGGGYVPKGTKVYRAY